MPNQKDPKNILEYILSKKNSIVKFLWKDNSFESWLVNLLIAFLIINFLVFPFLSFLTKTDQPIASIVSESMEHHPGQFDDWWITNGHKYSEFNITKSDFENFEYDGGLKIGDLIISGKRPSCDYEVGDVIIFRAGIGYPVIHRVVDISTDSDGNHYFRTLGDNNPKSLPIEMNISDDQVEGYVVHRIKFVGYIKVMFLNVAQALF